MEEHLRFENSVFCSRNCTFLKFFAHNLSLFINFDVMFKFNYPWGLFSRKEGGGVAYT